MSDRLSPLDTSFLYWESAATPMHVGALAVFDTAQTGLSVDRLTDLLRSRLSLVPRYRQRLLAVPGRLANPVWADDPDFDVGFHLRRSTVPAPGTEAQLSELVARIMSRQLDRSRPLWELYVVEGLAEGRTALVTKTHHAMVDGLGALDIGALLLDATPEPRETPPDDWSPEPMPGRVRLVASALGEYARRPTVVAEAVTAELSDLRAAGSRVMGALSGLLSATRVVGRTAPSSPLRVTTGTGRRFAVLRTELDDYKRVRKAHGGTINDVVLATVAGALRAWLLTRAEPVTASTTLRAMVPVSVRSEGDTSGNAVSAYFVDLPVGEPSPVLRLQQISFAMRAHKEAGQAVAADALVRLSGFAPPTLHALGARLANAGSSRVFNLLVTNVPGPQFPLYAAGARMLACYPYVPLAQGQALAVGVTSYDGGAYYGLVADRESVPDVDVVADCLRDALAELLESAR